MPRIERHGFEHYRHRTLSLYAARETATSRVHGKTTVRHTSQDFVAVLKELLLSARPCNRSELAADSGRVLELGRSIQPAPVLPDVVALSKVMHLIVTQGGVH